MCGTFHTLRNGGKTFHRKCLQYWPLWYGEGNHKKEKNWERTWKMVKVKGERENKRVD